MVCYFSIIEIYLFFQLLVEVCELKNITLFDVVLMGFFYYL